MRKIYPILFAALVTLTGCGKDAGSVEAREESDPNIISGQEFMEQGDYDAAIAEFRLALDQDPMMARPHLDLAIIYQQHKINYIHSIYHYDRYLELRPDAEKAAFINEQKLKVAQALANTLINNSPEVKKVVQERNTLIQQNNDLKRQLADALKKSAPVTASTVKPKPAASSSQTVTETVPKTATSGAAQKHQIYHVVGGDTLSKISTKFYGDSSRWDVIYDANKDRMRNASDLKVGQTIVIPAIGQ
ncbi:LysM peptidoglycan-binding domain-containing protein [Pontiellaceae bacterium B12219]|nr:LysM peptidoglycan-binding domain-containing protein [Pontiellaceae bacterium B12219]